MNEKEPKATWSDCDQVFFTGGKGWGLTDSLQTICLGKEEDIKKFLETWELNPDLRPVQRQVLLEIQNYKKERLEDGRKPELKGSRDVRSRPARTTKRRTARIRQPSARKRIPVH